MCARVLGSYSGSSTMEWVTRENIKRFERLIEKETDPFELKRLEELLAGEREKLRGLGAPTSSGVSFR
jgi:hypothetical protein